MLVLVLVVLVAVLLLVGEGCDQLWEPRVSGSRSPTGPRPGPPAQPSPPARSPARLRARPPARPRVLPPSQPGARGIVRWNTAPSSPRRGGKTPWCSPSKA